MFDFPAVLAKQPEGGFVVTFVDVPEAITQGEDREEALLYAIDALETALSFYVDERRPIPVPSKAKRGQRLVRPGVLESASWRSTPRCWRKACARPNLRDAWAGTCRKWIVCWT